MQDGKDNEGGFLINHKHHLEIFSIRTKRDNIQKNISYSQDQSKLFYKLKRYGIANHTTENSICV